MPRDPEYVPTPAPRPTRQKVYDLWVNPVLILVVTAVTVGLFVWFIAYAL